MWSHFYSDGGFGMYPITVFGLLLVTCAAMLALRPERERVPLLVSLASLLGASSVLGFSLGIISTCRHVLTLAPERQLPVLSTGIAEALNIIVLAAMMFVVSGLCCAVAAVRGLNAPAGARG